jgi:hypothetical protein
LIPETTFKVKAVAEEGKEETAIGREVEKVREELDLTLIER